MRTANPDVFALKNSGLGAFLYADVGAEENSSTMTVLSMLARLGKDPWAQAGEWASIPQAAATDDLSNCIAQMPLAPGDTAVSRAIAERLVQLLPGYSQAAMPSKPGTAMPAWLPWLGLVVWMMLSMLPSRRPANDGDAPVAPPTANIGSTENPAARAPQ